MLEATSAPVGLGSSATGFPGLAPGSGTDPGDPVTGLWVVVTGPGVPGSGSINKGLARKTSTNTKGLT
jgi:hypothetical protein